jgi:hypothetical protein
MTTRIVLEAGSPAHFPLRTIAGLNASAEVKRRKQQLKTAQRLAKKAKLAFDLALNSLIAAEQTVIQSVISLARAEEKAEAAK